MYHHRCGRTWANHTWIWTLDNGGGQHDHFTYARKLVNNIQKAS